jgi:hypothetical protein
MSNPIGRLVEHVPPVARRRILLGCLIGAVLVYELDSVAENDQVPGDSISETNRWCKDQLARFIGEPAATVAWFATWGTAAAWYAAHIAKKTLPVNDN